jgi:hypothetical protein
MLVTELHLAPRLRDIHLLSLYVFIDRDDLRFIHSYLCLTVWVSNLFDRELINTSYYQILGKALGLPYLEHVNDIDP